MVTPFQQANDSGPVLVAVEYDVPSENVHEFLKAVRRYGRLRRRDGVEMGHFP